MPVSPPAAARRSGRSRSSGNSGSGCQKITCPSNPPETSRWLSGENASASTERAWMRAASRRRPVARWSTSTLPSSSPAASHRPSADQASDVMVVGGGSSRGGGTWRPSRRVNRRSPAQLAEASTPSVAGEVQGGDPGSVNGTQSDRLRRLLPPDLNGPGFEAHRQLAGGGPQGGGLVVGRGQFQLGAAAEFAARPAPLTKTVGDIQRPEDPAVRIEFQGVKCGAQRGGGGQQVGGGQPGEGVVGEGGEQLSTVGREQNVTKDVGPRTGDFPGPGRGCRGTRSGPRRHCPRRRSAFRLRARRPC